MQSNQSPFFGMQISFTDRFGRTFEGLIVKTSTYSYCPGANSYTAYVDDPASSRVYSLPLGGFRVIGWPGAGAIDQARASYVAYLSQYPAWRENFASGITVGW